MPDTLLAHAEVSQQLLRPQHLHTSLGPQNALQTLRFLCCSPRLVQVEDGLRQKVKLLKRTDVCTMKSSKRNRSLTREVARSMQIIDNATVKSNFSSHSAASCAVSAVANDLSRLNLAAPSFSSHR